MARFIDLDSLDADTALWLIPEEWIRFDQRDPPWPNIGWPYAAWITVTHHLFNQVYMIKIRQWCERELQGDVVARMVSREHYNDAVQFCFDVHADQMQFCDRFSDLIIEVQDPIRAP